MKNLKLKELTKQELKEINGGDFGITLAGIGLAILGMAIYEHGKHFVAGMFNPFTSNE
jgi:lactobin A/cerein 7B family class IIb bacteriocin